MVNVVPTGEIVLGCFETVNDQLPYFMTDALPWLAVQFVAFINHGIRTYPVRKAHKAEFEASLSPLGREVAINELDDFWERVWRFSCLRSDQALLLSGAIKPDRLMVFETFKGCPAAEAKHGTQMLAGELIEYPLKDCDRASCMCGFRHLVFREWKAAGLDWTYSNDI